MLGIPVSSISSYTPVSKSFTKSFRRHPIILKSNNQITKDPKEVANSLANYFASVSSLRNCSESFASQAFRSESISINFGQDPLAGYNLPL